MIDIDLVNVDFDISKDKEHTTKYLNQYDKHIPQVLDNTYREHIRAVLNYSPILQVRQPFRGCKPIEQEVWVGTYLGIHGYPVKGTYTLAEGETLGKFISSTMTEWSGGIEFMFIFSIPETDHTKPMYLKKRPTGEFEFEFDELETDISKDGKLLTKADLEQGVEVLFLPANEDTHKTVYILPYEPATSSYGTTSYYEHLGYQTDKLYIHLGKIELNGRLINNLDDIDIKGTELITSERYPYLRLVGYEPIKIDVRIKDGYYPMSNIANSIYQGWIEYHLEHIQLNLIRGQR